MLAGLLTGIAAGVALGFLALLPWFLGLFFFLLLGLLPSAVLFRCSDPIRPVPAGALCFGAVVIIAGTWFTSIYVEYRLLPSHVAVKVRRGITSGFPKGYTRDLLRDYVAAYIDRDIKQRYGSSGLIGYVKWAANSGRIEIPPGSIQLGQAGGDSKREPVVLEMSLPARHRLHQPGLLWCVRVGVSILLLILAFVMQLVPLHQPAPEALEAEAEQEAPGGAA